MTKLEKTAGETSRLMRAIGALSSIEEKSTADGRELELDGGGSTSVINRIFVEINETVLRRDLRFSTQGDNDLTLEVMERRILCVKALGPKLAGRQKYSGIVGQPLTSERVPLILELLKDFSKGVSEVRITSTIPQDPQKTAFAGIFSDDLVQHAHLQEASQIAPQSVLATIEEINPSAHAIYCGNGVETLTRWGNDEICDKLARLMPDAAAAAQKRTVRLWYTDAEAIVLSKNADICVWCVVDASDAAHIYRLWYEAVFA